MKYFQFVADYEGETEIIFGSYKRAECIYEMDAEKASLKDQGYKKPRIICIDVEEKPAADIYIEESAEYTDLEDATNNLDPELLPELKQWHDEAAQRAKDEGYAVLAFNGESFGACEIMPEDMAKGFEWQTVAEYYGTDNGIEIVPNNDFIAGA